MKRRLLQFAMAITLLFGVAWTANASITYKGNVTIYVGENTTFYQTLPSNIYVNSGSWFLYEIENNNVPNEVQETWCAKIVSANSQSCIIEPLASNEDLYQWMSNYSLELHCKGTGSGNNECYWKITIKRLGYLTVDASPAGGKVDPGTKVTLTAKNNGSTVSGCDIYYTLDGSTPTTSSTKYTSSGVTINSSCWLKAKAFKAKYESSSSDEWYYTTELSKFTAKTKEGVDVFYEVTEDGGCQVYNAWRKPAIDISTSGVITIPSTVNGYKVTRIGDYAFYSCESITEVDLPTTILSIGEYAFANCSSLSKFTGLDNVEMIDEWAFNGTLWRKNQSNGPIYIGKTFYEYIGNMPKDTHFEIQSGTLGIASGAFVNHYSSTGYSSTHGNLKSVTILKSVKHIGKGIFYCPSLNSIVIQSGNQFYESPDNCNAIIESKSKTLIAGCNTTIVPKNVKTIAEEAFSDLELTSIFIPNSVESIERYAFYSCDDLETVVIGKGINSIASDAFNFYDSKMATLWSLSTNPPKISDYVFESGNQNYTDVYQNTTLMVPKGCKSKYQSTDGWKKFVNIVESDYVPVTSINITGNSPESMKVGEEKQLSVSITPSNASIKDVTWLSDNINVATVTRTGLVTAIGEGTAYITCKANDGSGASATCTIYVNNNEEEKSDVYLVSVTCDNQNLDRLTNNDKLIFHATFGNNGATDTIPSAIMLLSEDAKRVLASGDYEWTVVKKGEQVTVDYEYALDTIPQGQYKATVLYYDWNKDGWYHNGEYVQTINIVNNSTKGTEDDPFTPAEANEYGSTLASNEQSDKDYYIRGRVSSIREQFGTQYGNATFYISLDGTEKDQFHVYRALYLGNTKYAGQDLLLRVGDDVVVCGKITNYLGTLPETVQEKAYVVSINGVTSGVADAMMDKQPDAPIYNLRGQRLSAPQKGINIIGGKKVVVK